MDSPTLDILQGLPVACFRDACYKLTRSGWLHLQDTLHTRRFHTSAVVKQSVLLVGGEDSLFTTEILSRNGEEAREGFSLHARRKFHCSIQV